jgi:periplasmic protein CpxP/Spy
MYKKLFILFGIFLFFQGFAAAQSRMNRMNPQERAKVLQDSLKLNDQQTQEVANIYAQSDSMMSEKFNDSTLSRADRRAFMRSMMDSTNAKIESVLTDDQKAEFQKYLQERRDRFNRMRDNQNQQN